MTIETGVICRNVLKGFHNFFNILHFELPKHI